MSRAATVTAGLIALALSQGAIGQMKLTENLTPDPLRAPFVHDDVHNFVRALGLLASDADTIGILQAEYFDRGTSGLRAFVARYDLTAERLRDAIRRYPAEYATLGIKAALLTEQEEAYRAAYAQLKTLIPDAAFPPTYFLVGAYRGIGSGSEEGPLITIEKESEASLRGGFTTMLVHEMVHMQQVQATGLDKYRAIFGPEKSLLALTIREGIAEYFADRVTGRMTQEEARAYVANHELELWERFRLEMLGAETGEWMWATPSDSSQPPHVAYVIGARIARAYYDNAADKRQAVRDILAVTDYPVFLARSGYESRLTRPSP